MVYGDVIILIVVSLTAITKFSLSLIINNQNVHYLPTLVVIHHLAYTVYVYMCCGLSC